MSNSSDSTVAPPGHAKALVILGVVVLGVAIYIGLAVALGMTTFYGGFLFILYWMTFKHADLAEFWPALLGAATGLGIAWMLHNLPILMGPPGMGIALAVVLLAIYCLVVGWIPVIINASTMLFLTVGTIPALQTEVEFQGFLMSLFYGAALAGGVLYLVARLRRPRAGTAATI